jgi:hypothetical protein
MRSTSKVIAINSIIRVFKSRDFMRLFKVTFKKIITNKIMKNIDTIEYLSKDIK